MVLSRDFGRGPVGLDTAVFIYFVEEHPRHIETVEEVLTRSRGLRMVDLDRPA